MRIIIVSLRNGAKRQAPGLVGNPHGDFPHTVVIVVGNKGNNNLRYSKYFHKIFNYI